MFLIEKQSSFWETVEDEVDFILIGVRYLLPLLRLTVWIKNTKKREDERADFENVDFGMLDADHDDAVELGRLSNADSLTITNSLSLVDTLPKALMVNNSVPVIRSSTASPLPQ